jgi:hypothetical protein
MPGFSNLAIYDRPAMFDHTLGELIAALLDNEARCGTWALIGAISALAWTELNL